MSVQESFSYTSRKGIPMKWIVVSAVVSILCGVCSAEPPQSLCAAVTVTADQRPSYSTPPAFNAVRTLQLEYHIELSSPVTGQHVIEVDVATPNGHRYQVLTAPVSDDPSHEGVPTRVTGYPYPVPIRALHLSTSRGQEVQGTTLRLPVAGTPILSNSLLGTWSLRVRLDGADVSCNGPELFQLLPMGEGIFADDFESGSTSSWAGP